MGEVMPDLSTTEPNITALMSWRSRISFSKAATSMASGTSCQLRSSPPSTLTFVPGDGDSGVG
jgi:hypothetical protein